MQEHLVGLKLAEEELLGGVSLGRGRRLFVGRDHDLELKLMFD